MMKSFIFSVFLFFASLAWAQIPGKIVGKVTDQNGTPLPGVNIVVEGESLGASTDDDGFYIVLNISPGRYTLTASYVSYHPMTIKGVEVKPDLTTRVNFVLKEEVMELDKAIVVTAEQPVIQRDATAKVTTLNAEEIRALPVENLQEILSTQSNVSVLTNTPNAKPGYNIRGIDDIRMRGGRNNEVALLIDGVKVSNPIFGGFGTQLGKNAIEQISIEAGGFSAKYGNALSGVINLTTKEGRGKTSGSFRYYTSRPFGMEQLGGAHGVALNRQNFQYTLGGRPSFFKKFSYFIAGEVNTQAGTTLKFDNIAWDDYRRIQFDTDDDGQPDSSLLLPSSREIIDGYLQYGNLDSIQKNLGRNWKLVKGPDGRRINPIDQYKGWKGLGWNNYYNVFSKFSYQLTPNIKIRFSNLFDRRYRQINNFNAWYDYNMPGQNVQILGSNKQTLSVNHALSSRTFYTLRLSRFYESRKIRILRDYSRKFVSKFNRFDPPAGNLKSPEEYVPYRSTKAVTDPFETAFYLKADNRWYSGDHSTNLEARFDLTSQFTKTSKIETGFQFNYIDLYYHSYQNISQVDPYPTIYHKIPKEGALYVQIKSEFDKLIVNTGLRLDYQDSGGRFWVNPFDPLGPSDDGGYSLHVNPVVRVKPKYHLSPRIGLAYPLTSTTVLFFNFGHFYQNPNYRDLYRASGSTRLVSLVRGNIIGNPNLQPEKAVQYEISLQQQIGNDIGLKINLWSKETTNQVGSVVVPAYSDPGHDNPFTYAVFVNNNFGSARGIDIEIKKALRRHFGFQINYTFSKAKVLLPTSWDGYWSGDTQDDLPKHETTAPWDQPHVLRANFQYYIGKKQGIRLGQSFPLQNMVLSLIYYGESGLPYTPTIPGGVIVEPYSQRWPASHRFDLRVSKEWPMLGQRFRMFLEVKNLFDRKNVLTGYTRTGSPTNPGTASYYTYSSIYWDSRNNNNFALRRLVYWGLEVIFN